MTIIDMKIYRLIRLDYRFSLVCERVPISCCLLLPVNVCCVTKAWLPFQINSEVRENSRTSDRDCANVRLATGD